MAMKLYPLKFEPIFKHRLWGDRKLAEVFGKDLPAEDSIGESWELADLPEDKSRVVNGPLAGETIASVVEQFGEEVMGIGYRGGQFPLLIKILDASDVLSVQVHPDEAACRRMGKGDPKTECWYVISAEPDAVIYKGVKRGVTPEQFGRAIENGTVAELLDKVHVKQGECHFLPAGTAHSIGAGLLIAEIQTPSDTTYRVFDWNRVDSDGNPRQLHLDEALESIDFGLSAADLPATEVGRLVDSEYFKVDKGHQMQGCEVLVSADKLKAYMFLSGRGRFEAHETVSTEFVGGDCVLVPAIYEGVMSFAVETEYLCITL